MVVRERKALSGRADVGGAERWWAWRGRKGARVGVGVAEE